MKMNTEKNIANTLMDAMKMHEESYQGMTQEYNLSMEHCLIEAGKKHNLTMNMWALLNLAMHWSNDIQCWADDVMAEKNILDECNKKTIMEGEIKDADDDDDYDPPPTCYGKGRFREESGNCRRCNHQVGCMNL